MNMITQKEKTGHKLITYIAALLVGLMHLTFVLLSTFGLIPKEFTLSAFEIIVILQLSMFFGIIITNK